MKPDTSPPPDHGPDADNHPLLVAKQSRVALTCFFVYLAAYGGFMALAAFWPKVMARPVLAGVNLAIVYGLALIGGAVLLALIYMAISSSIAAAFHAEDRDR
jgi:uncharacterized membrane protein (DUF485 family)